MILKRKDWKYFNRVVPEVWDYDDVYHKYRWCKNTGKLQEFDTHCLGLNPPEYIGEWRTIKGKPRFRYDINKGVWYIHSVKKKKV